MRHNCKIKEPLCSTPTDQAGQGLWPLCDLGLPHWVVHGHVCISQLELHNKILQIREFRKQELIFSQFWGLQVQGQGAGRVSFSEGLSVACRQPPSPCVPWVLHSLSSVWICPWHISSGRDPNHIGLGSGHVISFNLITP